MSANSCSENSKPCTWCQWKLGPEKHGVGNWVNERARNAKCSRFGRLRCQAIYLPPTSLYTHILWQSLSCMLRVTLESEMWLRDNGEKVSLDCGLLKESWSPSFSGHWNHFALCGICFLPYPNCKGMQRQINISKWACNPGSVQNTKGLHTVFVFLGSTVHPCFKYLYLYIFRWK